MQDTGMMKRIFIATFISFVFFIAYDYFVMPQSKPTSQTQAKQATQTTTQKSVEKTKIKQTTNELKSKVIATIKSKKFEVQIDNLGRISKYILENKIFTNKKGDKLQILSDKLPKPLEIRFKNAELNKEAFHTSVTIDKNNVEVTNKPQTVTITQKLSKLTLTKIITFYPDGHYDLKVNLSSPEVYYISNGYRPDKMVDKLTIHGALIKDTEGKLDIIDDGDAENKTIKNAIVVAGFDRYYTSLLYSKKPFTVIVSPDSEKNPVTFIKADSNINLIGYVGPKYVDTLRGISPDLVSVVQYGLGTFFSEKLFVLLDFFHKLVGNWGIAIILFVVLIRVILFPLTYRGMASMYKLKLLAPKMKQLKEKYSKDPQKFQIKMMELYKKEKVNPMGGCLPMLLQIPIFYGIYKLLLYSIELKGAHFLWIHDLSSMDPYFILPVVMGITMYAHQLITPNNFQDPMQEKIFKFLPVIFTIMMATFAAGLVLYWTVNNTLSFIQQYIINKSMEAKGLVDKKENKK